jgi:hypothetical protein
VKDERLFMTFPNDMHRHPKLTRISVAARWAFIEMNGEARLNDNDGVFSAEDAEFMWSPDLLAELVGSHPSKPLVQRVDDTYVIREFAKHQQTKADREALAQKRSEAGKAGAAKRWQGDSKAMASAKQMVGKPKQAIAESESESESELQTDLTSISSQSANPLAVDNFRTDSIQESEEQIAGARALAATQKLDLEKIRQLASERCGRDLRFGEALRLGTLIVSKSRVTVRSPTSYVVRAFNEPFEVQQLIDKEVRT